MAGYSGTPLARKLGIKPGHSVALVNAPVDFEAALEPLPEGVALDRRVPASAEVIIFFTASRSDLEARFASLTAVLPPDGNIWIAWPKRASRVPTDITEDVLRELILPTGYVDTKVCAVDETWSGLRFTLRKELRA